MAIQGWPPISDQRDQRPARSGCARLVGCGLLILVGLAFLSDVGISSFLCMDTQGDNMACAMGLVGGHITLYVAGVALIGLITYVVRRVTR